MKLPNQENIRTHGEMKTYKFLKTLEEDTFKHAQTKKLKKEYIRRRRNLFSKSNSSSSSCCTASTDLPGPLSPLVPIVHCSR